MNDQEKGMDRREFIKTSLAAAGGLALTSWMGDATWAQTTAYGDLADLSLFELSKRIHSGEITSKQLVEIYLERIQKFGGIRVPWVLLISSESAPDCVT